MNTRRLAVAVPAMLLTATAACGIPAEEAPRGITAPNGRYDAAASARPATGAPGSIAETVYFVADSRLTAITRSVGTYPDLATHLQHLLSGPTIQEAAAGLSSALTGTTTIGEVRPNGAEAIVSVGDSPEGSSRSDEALAFGQIVCTLASRPGTAVVSFTRDGQPLGVPRADGSLSEGALTCGDYTGLLTDGG
ncbi:GerMN domain-containing protein [Catenuloplanes indicus]|uniref:GerMN domain-containing protein n=1 Tax=Catenuloplanes indicus TaxID=137267 RepID=A0AAE3VVT5_9ACTN|nr:GerMN domain-containing protein [Catenuloplanes indicus]MDQ0365158.1 hypothetical protein [Catenuloplanes indicus]